LPLPDQAGRALAAYLRSAPPQGATRRLFRTVRSQRARSRSWLSQRVGAARARAGLGAPGKGAHRLRRTFATHRVQPGARLKAVADLLGHASLSTTQVYAKVNLPMLRAVAPPWPGEVRPGKRVRSKPPWPFICRAAAAWASRLSRKGPGWKTGSGTLGSSATEGP
jgi:integrase